MALEFKIFPIEKSPINPRGIGLFLANIDENDLQPEYSVLEEIFDNLKTVLEKLHIKHLGGRTLLYDGEPNMFNLASGLRICGFEAKVYTEKYKFR